MIPIKFTFRPEKFGDMLVFFAGRVPELTTLKAAKLFYLADRAHLLKYGRPIMGDWYEAKQHGPVPSNAYDSMQYLRGDEGWVSPEAELLKGRLDVDTSGNHPVFSASKNEPLDDLSQAELESLEAVLAEYGSKSASALVKLTHKHIAWAESRGSELHEIDYRLFFAENGEAAGGALETMEWQQEDRDFLSQLECA